jgi:uncharacterized membrane protein YjjP (DUF1212 family)
MAALDAGRMVMEAGANAKGTEEIVKVVARGLGAETVELRIGYASLAITIGVAGAGITRMRAVGPLGVNQRLAQNLWDRASQVARGELTPEDTRAGLARLAKETPRYSAWLTALAVGVACAAFGRLLAVDWPAVVPVLLAATIGQYLRGRLLRLHVNLFICTGLISFLSSALGGCGARLVGSNTVPTAMIASILLLVPGVPAVNAQTDILLGHPTLGSARLATVLTILVFMAVGLWGGEVAVELLGHS